MPPRGIKEVARHAGVSVGTVSNVLNRPDVVAPATRQRVLDAIEALGFVRNETARQLRAGRSRTIGLIVLDVANPFFTDVARGAEMLAEENDSVIMLCNSGEDPAREQRHLDILEEQRVQGVLISPVDTDNPRLDQLARRGMPVVLVDRDAGRSRCSVAVDDVLGGRLAGAHLLEQGHRHIAYVSGPFSIRQVADRQKGAVDAVAEHGGDAEVTTLEMPNLTVASGRTAASRIVAMPAHRRPTAVFCANDLLALGMLQGMTQQGLRVPADIAIVGYDDIDFAGAAAVPLSSVRQPREDLGRAATELLLDEVTNPDHHRHRQVVFEPDLVVRESSAQRRRRRTPVAKSTARA